jgi:drug/metabolite transporter (DMT)-like permease
MSSLHKQGMGATEWALLVTLSILWGGSFFFAKVAIQELPPLSIVFGRVAIAAVVLNALVSATRQRMPRDLSSWAAFSIMGMLNNFIPFSLIFWAQIEIDSGLAAILIGTTPLFTVMLAHVLATGEQLSWNRLGGVLVGFAGLTIMIGVEVLSGLELHVLAKGAVLLAAISYAAASIFGRRFMGQSPLITATGQITASSVIVLPIAMLVDQPWTMAMPHPVTMGAVAGLALLSTALAYIIFFRILAAAGATNISLVTLLVPVSALFLGHSILGERLALQQFGGMGLIALGLMLIDDRAAVALQSRVMSWWSGRG